MSHHSGRAGAGQARPPSRVAISRWWSPSSRPPI